MILRVLLLAMLFSPPIMGTQAQWEQIRSMAESQHEIVMLLVEKKEFSKVFGEAKKIFELSFPVEQEDMLVESTRLQTSALVHHQQYPIAHQILDLALASVKTVQAKAQLHKEKAFVFKKEGKDDEALKSFEKSFQLDKQSSP